MINGTDHPYGYNGKEENDELGLATLDFGWRNYDAALGRWMNIDPMAPKREWVSPFNYVQNNPIFRFDPDGLTDYTLDKKTGEVKQIGKANDEPDRILKTNSKGEIKRKGQGLFGFLTKKSERGKAKVAVNGIEKGILEDGKNMKTESTVTEVNLDSNSNDKAFENSVLKISNYLDVELSGYYFNDNSDGKDYAYIHKFEGNTDTHADARINFKISNKPSLGLNNIDLKVHWHTHLSKFDDKYRLVPSSQGRRGGDLGFKRRTLSNPNLSTLRFMVITNPKSFEY